MNIYKLDILNILKRPFPEEHIKERAGNNGKKFKYVPIDLVIQRLDEAFPLKWSWAVLDSKITEIEKRVDWDKSTQPWTPIMGTAKQVAVLGRLTLHIDEGFSVSRDAWGGSDLGKGGQAGDDFKIADSNALAKAAYRFGVASHIGLEAKLEEENYEKPFPNKQSYNKINNNSNNIKTNVKSSNTTNKRNPLR